MAKFWKVYFYTGGDDYETDSFLISDEQYKKIQLAIQNGAEFVSFPEKPTIRVRQIASIVDADEEVEEYKRYGIVGKKENLLLPEVNENLRRKRLSDFIEKTRSDFYKRMGWN